MTMTRQEAIAEWYRRKGLTPPPQPVQSVPTTQPTGITSEPVPPKEQEAYDKQVWLEEQLRTGKIKSIEPTFWDRIKMELPENIGGGVGAWVGAKGGAEIVKQLPPTTPPLLKGAAVVGGATLGAFVGGMGGKGYEQLYQMNQPGAKSKTLGELYSEQAESGLTQAELELAGRGIAKVGGKILAPFAKYVTPAAKTADKLLRKVGAHLTPAQMTNSGKLDTLEAITEGSLFGGGRLRDFKAYTQTAAYKNIAQDVADIFTEQAGRKLNPTETGMLLAKNLQDETLAFRKTADELYKHVDSISGDATVVSTDRLKRFVANRLKSAEQMGKIGSSQMGDTLLGKVTELPDYMTFAQARELRSRLLKEAAAIAGSNNKDTAIGLASNLVKLADKSIVDAGGRLPEEVLPAWRAANKFFRTGKQKFESEVITKLSKNLESHPEKLSDFLFQPGAATQLREAKRVLSGPSITAAKASLVEKWLSRATSEAEQGPRATKLLAQAQKMGPEMMKEIFSPNEIRALEELTNIGKIIQKSATSGSGGKMLIQLQQAGAIVALVGAATGSGKLTAAGATILITPYALSRLITNPRWSKWLTTGLKLPTHSPEAATTSLRLIGALKDIYFDEANRQIENNPFWNNNQNNEQNVGL